MNAGRKSLSQPAVSSADGTIYVGSDDHHLYAINSDGTESWRFETSSPVRAAPAIHKDETIYVGDPEGIIHAIRPGQRYACKISGVVIGGGKLSLSFDPPLLPKRRAITGGNSRKRRQYDFSDDDWWGDVGGLSGLPPPPSPSSDDAGSSCSSSSECSSNDCRGGNCCNSKGKSTGCTDCDYEGDCATCSSGYTRINYECFVSETSDGGLWPPPSSPSWPSWGDDDDFCPFTDDGECDEPEYCAYGTDANDCKSDGADSTTTTTFVDTTTEFHHTCATAYNADFCKGQHKNDLKKKFCDPFRKLKCRITERKGQTPRTHCVFVFFFFSFPSFLFLFYYYLTVIHFTPAAYPFNMPYSVRPPFRPQNPRTHRSCTCMHPLQPNPFAIFL